MRRPGLPEAGYPRKGGPWVDPFYPRPRDNLFFTHRERLRLQYEKILSWHVYCWFIASFMPKNKNVVTLLIWTKKISQRIPRGVLNMFYILWTTTDYAQMKIFLLIAWSPGGAVIIFPKSGQNQNLTPLLLIKKLLLPLLSVSEIFLGWTVLDLWIFCPQ